MSVEVISYGNVPDAIAKGNEAALLDIVTRVTAQAKVLAPVDTGQLKGSIMGKVKGAEYGHEEGPKFSETAKAGEGVVGSGILHSIYNEFGTRKMAAQPFLRPAVSSEANNASVRKTVAKLQAESVAQGMKKGPRKKKVYK